MHGLPERLPGDGHEAFTGLVCPDCSGNLVISVQGPLVSFSCRVGHAYGLAELVLAKDAAVETVLWRAVFAFEEMAALLDDLNQHGVTDPFGPEATQARSELAREQAGRLRAIIDTDRPLVERRGDRESDP